VPNDRIEKLKDPRNKSRFSNKLKEAEKKLADRLPVFNFEDAQIDTLNKNFADFTILHEVSLFTNDDYLIEGTMSY